MIVIDPGHGGDAACGNSSCFGAHGPGGTLEKDVTLALARRVARRFGGGVELTRTEDRNLSLAERIRTARDHGARVFVSLHASGGPEHGGAYIHPFCNPASDDLGHQLGRRLKVPVRRDAELGILAPDRFPAHTAAALLEVDALTTVQGERRLRDRAVLDAYGHRIARAIRDYVTLTDPNARQFTFGRVRKNFVSCEKYPRSYPIFKAIGTTDPVGMIRAADTLAIKLLDSTIKQLDDARKRIIAGESPAAVVSKRMAASLKVRMLIDASKKSVWTGKKPGSVFFVMRWLRNIRKILNGGWMRYTCLDKDCDADTWAAAIPGKMRIFLCRKWWRGGDGTETPKQKADNRALTLMHEASHIYYSTEDSGRGQGSAECIEQFVGDLNNIPVPKEFQGQCGPGKLPGIP